MIATFKNLYDYRELIAVLTWKSVTPRYKQAYLVYAWAVVKPPHALADFYPAEKLCSYR
jgi:lipopolysaccharide transport system permease protein